jgi:hypothetical protein
MESRPILGLCAGLFLASSAFSAATLTINPSTLYDCSSGEATATINWSGASGPVDVRVLQHDGPSFTGTVNPSGSATTGPWVSDGMQFFLVNQSGITEATATARVRCGGSAKTIDQGLGGGSYFPLQVGNTWVYRYNTRFITNDYIVRSVTGTEVINGQTYYDLTDTTSASSTVVLRLRGDNNGVIHALTGSGEVVYVDPTVATGHTSYLSLVGKFDDAITTGSFQGLMSNSSIFARGVGLVSSQNRLETGSSGGFTDGLELIEARIDNVIFSLPASRLKLAIENPDLDVGNHKAPNCTVPCYFVACYLAPGSDPPDTYRPCVQTRIESSYGQAHSVQLQFFNPSGTMVYDTSLDMGAQGGVHYFRLPLYTATGPIGPFTILPAGLYKLAARMSVGGVEVGVDSLTVRIE